MKKRINLTEGWELRQAEEDVWLPIHRMPAQVADALLEKGILPEEVKLGWCQSARWIQDHVWEYRLSFPKPEGNRCDLVMEGLDTLADLYLNGELIGTHDDFYLPCRLDITDKCKAENVLLIRFHSVLKWLEQKEMPEHLRNAVLKCKLLRKPLHDFPMSNGEEEAGYQGAVPSFTPVGVYGDIYLETWENVRITADEIRATLEEENSKGRISWQIAGEREVSSTEEALTVCADLQYQGISVARQTVQAEGVGHSFTVGGDLLANDPCLWWPRGFGEQNLYTLKLTLQAGKDSRTVDRLVKQVGFREVEMPVPLCFLINGKKVRLWGGSMDPMQGYTHCYQPERAARILDMVENANMNTLRIWGEGIPLPDAFYEEADRRGILIWQEFFMGHGAYPDNEAYEEKCVEEAEVLIRRLRHHACLLMWCGGNETIMGAEYIDEKPYGERIVKEAFPKLVKRLDPERHYHVNSPYGGEWANDPREGDTHTYDCVWEYPYQEYPNFLSENIRTAPPVKHSLKKMIRGELWTADTDVRVTEPDQGIMPANWRQRSHLAACGERKSGDYWEYYDACDADGLLYNMGASYGAEIKKAGEMVRRGSKGEADYTKRTKGYMSCKLLDTWPKVYCAVIDYFQEGFIPYYATKRVLTPVLASFAKEESIRLYVVNDSPADFAGTVELGLYDLRRESFRERDSIEVAVPQGDCRMVYDLERFRFFSKDCVLYARVSDSKGEEVSTDIDYVDIERHLPFQDPLLHVEIEGDILSIRSEHFARCVSITGSCEGDEFGWLFTDNYFDLMPGMVRRVKILGRHDHGELIVKGRYSREECSVIYK